MRIAKLDDQLLSVIKVYHKTRIHLEHNCLRTLAITSSHFINVTVLHLENNQMKQFSLSTVDHLANLKVTYLSVHPPTICVITVDDNILTDRSLIQIFLPKN